LITCADFMAEIGNYLEGDVADEVRLQLERHLSHCVTCQVVVNSSRKTIQIVTDSGSFDLPQPVLEPMAKAIMAQIRKKRDSEKRL
jgi:anti-sigma factor RsiW